MVHAFAVESHRPGNDAYGRVTNPERYESVVDAARALMAGFVAVFEVELTSGDPRIDFPEISSVTGEVIRLRPRQGAPLAFMFTGFPGVIVGSGKWCVEQLPACGCDACDESPQEVVDRLSRLMGAVVDGRFEEELTKRSLSYTSAGVWGSSSSKRRLVGGEWKKYGSPGFRQWPAWSRS